MGVTSIFDVTAQQRYGLPSGAQTRDDSTLATTAGPAPIAGTPLWHPNHPLFWVGGILALTFGFAFASTTVRVGPAHAHAALGKD